MLAGGAISGGVKYAVVDPVLRTKLQHEWNRPVLWPAFVALGLVVAGGIYGFAWGRRHDV
jgi:hypothetical protein